MHIDESGRDDQPAGVNDLRRRAVNFAHGRNMALGNRHISVIAGLARAIDQKSIFNQQVILHTVSLLPWAIRSPRTVAAFLGTDKDFRGRV